MKDKEKSFDEILKEFGKIDHSDEIYKDWKNFQEKERRNLSKYPQSRVEENRIQGRFFLAGFVILGIIGLLAFLS